MPRLRGPSTDVQADVEKRVGLCEVYGDWVTCTDVYKGPSVGLKEAPKGCIRAVFGIATSSRSDGGSRWHEERCWLYLASNWTTG